MTVAGPVVGQHLLLGGRLDVGQPGRYPPGAIADRLGLGKGDCPFQHVEGLPGVAAGQPDQVAERLVVEGHSAGRPQLAGQTPLGVGDGPPDDGRDVLVGQRLEAPYAEPRQEGAVDLEVGVFGGGPDEGHRSVLDMGQEPVLLGLVEAVDLIDEEDGPTAIDRQLLTGRSNRCPDVGDAAHHRRQGGEACLDLGGEQPGEAGLAGPRRSPQQERSEVAPLHRPTQRAALAHEVVLADELGQVSRAHPCGQRLTPGWRLKQGDLVGRRLAARHRASLRRPLAQATLEVGGHQRRLDRPSPGSGGSIAVSIPLTKAATRRGSSCVPAAARRRLIASATVSALR